MIAVVALTRRGCTGSIQPLLFTFAIHIKISSDGPYALSTKRNETFVSELFCLEGGGGWGGVEL